ncbi:MAG TPA: 16S rRNA (guanine(966)-N(2))-methyltransferase RsmD [Spirochaetales bacterium]|nr:16S rRNA (guanine(966)-N(2))-methyltransferase RsmD [Spirochaetales bacterium]HQG39308.1 16S rRNA (guanine(966)-N(2))-methyltransferase RsmD [Spirochaetales bacterium]HRV28850.1 16S rRNA (guanine(966)-N(2))-methyltransferase RsmD [Spirochaetia bacterium]
MGTLRITGGELKGRIIRFAEGSLEIRPPMDRMRESVFSILGDITGSYIADIFAGSGIFSFEALSRGELSALCIEKDKAKIAALKKNAMLLGVSLKALAIPAEVFIKRASESFNLIFMDPPFPYKFKNELLSSIAQSNLLTTNGRLVFHFPQEDTLLDNVTGLKLLTTRKYGRSCINIYQRI